MTLELVQAVCLTPAIQFLEDHDVNVDMHLHATGLNAFAPRDPMAWLPKQLVFDFVARLDRYEFSDNPVEDLEPAYRLKNTHHYGRYLLSSCSLLEAAQRATNPRSRVLTYHRVSTRLGARKASINSHYHHRRCRVEQIIEGCSLLLMLDGLSQFGGKRCKIPALDITLDRLPETSLPIDLSDTRVRVSRDAHEVRVPMSWLLRKPAKKFPRSELSDWAPGGRLSDGLRVMFNSLAPGHRPNIEYFSELIEIPTRTIQRQLARENTTFFELVDEWARDSALKQVSEPAIRISEISKRLGYSEHAHFTRAFCRWTGKTPRAFRDTLN